MSKKLNKKTIILVILALIVVSSALFGGPKLGIITFLISVLIYMTITQRYMLKVFKAVKLYKIEEFSEALELYRTASLSPYCNASIINDYLICELKYGKASIAYEYITELFKNRTFKPHELLQLKTTYSTVLWKNNERTEAINILKDLLNENKSTYLYEALTSLLICAGNIHEAKTVVDEALEYTADSNILKSNYAEVNFKLGNYEKAESVFNEVLNANVKFVEPYFYLGLIESKKGNLQKAQEFIETAQGLNESLITAVKHEDINQAYNMVVFKSLNV